MSYNQPPPPPGGSDGPPPPPAGGYGGPPAGGPPAGVPRPAELTNRFLARLIDHVILGVVQVIFWVVLAAIFLTGFSHSFGEQLLFSLFLAILSTAVNVAYFAFLESNRGQTIGKMALKLKTVGPDGVSNPTMEQAVKRNGYTLLGFVGIIPIVGSFLGGLAMIGGMIYIAVTLNNDQPNHKGWHDNFAGGTQVLQVG